MAQRLLITGACGFTGRHLVSRLRGDGGRTLVGTGRQPGCDLPLDDYLPADLTDAESVAALVRKVRPDAVIHAAAVLAGTSEREIETANVRMFENLCDALRPAAVTGPIRVVTVGSAAELGPSGTSRLPATEEAPCGPTSPYGRAKLAVTRRAQAEPEDGPLRVVVARTFNLVGPGMDGRLSLGAFARQITAVARDEADAIRCGPLDARRDYVDVRDAVDAYAALLDRGRPGEIYNVCSGVSHAVGDLLWRLIDLAGIAPPRVESAAVRRAADLAEVYGSHAKLTRRTGWAPRIPVDQSLRDLLAEARGAAVTGPDRAPRIRAAG